MENVKPANKNYSEAEFEIVGLSKFNEVDLCDDDGSIAPLKISSRPIRDIESMPKESNIGTYYPFINYGVANGYV